LRRTLHSKIPIRPYQALAAALFGFFCLAGSSALGASMELPSPPLAGIWGLALVTGVAVLFGRRRLNLRSSTAALNHPANDFSRQLADALSRVPEQTPPSDRNPRANLRLRCVGGRKRLAPGVEDEIYGIAREALTNALRHSHAENIEVALTFSSDSLRVVVRDDGCGITPDLVAARQGSYGGLVLMRERAEQIGGQLRLRSALRRGTEVELSVPGVFSVKSRGSASAYGL